MYYTMIIDLNYVGYAIVTSLKVLAYSVRDVQLRMRNLVKSLQIPPPHFIIAGYTKQVSVVYHAFLALQ